MASGGLRRALVHAGVSTLDLLRTRLELAAVEFNEESERAKARLLLLVVAALFGAIALLAASALVVLLFWDTHRVAALTVVTLVHVAIALGAVVRLRASFGGSHAPFAQTLAELERDREWLSAMASDRAPEERER